MQDVQTYLEKLSTDAVDCALISRRATDPRKKVLFDRARRTPSDAGIRAGTCDRGERTLVDYFASPHP
jgi:hypothetical protein